MKHYPLCIFIFILAGCTQPAGRSTENNTTSMDSAVVNPSTYVIKKHNYPADQITDSVFFVNGEKYTIIIKPYAKGDHSFADTVGNRITLYQEEIIDISVNSKTVTISKSMFSHLYPDKNQFYHSCLGKTYIDKIDKVNRKVVFSTFFGFHQSDFGEILYYSISFDGKYEFINADVP